MGWELVAILSSGVFAGAAVYVSLIEHPARVECGTELAITEFVPSYHRGAIMQALLSAIGSISGIAAWLSGSGLWWLIGGLIIGAPIPFTLLVIFPINKKLLDPGLDRKSEQARDLMAQWARLHAVRTVLGVGAFILFACLLTLRS